MKRSLQCRTRSQCFTGLIAAAAAAAAAVVDSVRNPTPPVQEQNIFLESLNEFQHKNHVSEGET